MRKTIPALVLLTLVLLFSPFCRTDVSELLPVQTLYLCAGQGGCRIETDSGLMGQGRSLPAALADLRASAPGVAELSTAKQVLIADGAEAYGRALLLSDVLRPGTEVYRAPEALDVADACVFLSRHGVETTVARAQAADLRGEILRLPRLVGAEGRYAIEQANA